MFSGCTSLKTVVLPDTLTDIGSEAFLDCSSLVSIDIPDGVKALDVGVFSGCIALETVNLGDGFGSLAGFFDSENNVRNIRLPSAIADLNPRVLKLCPLEDLDLNGCPAVVLDSGIYTFTATVGGEPTEIKAAFPVIEGTDATVRDGTSFVLGGINADVTKVAMPKGYDNIYDVIDMFPNAREFVFADGSTLRTEDGTVYDGDEAVAVIPDSDGRLVIPDSVTCMEDVTCADKGAVREIVLPKDMEFVTDMSEYPNLENIDTSNNSRFIFEKGFLMDSEMTVLMDYAPAAAEHRVPATVTDSDLYFGSWTDLDRITFGNLTINLLNSIDTSFEGEIVTEEGSDLISDEGVIYSNGYTYAFTSMTDGRVELRDTVRAVDGDNFCGNILILSERTMLYEQYDPDRKPAAVYLPSGILNIYDDNVYLDRDGNAIHDEDDIPGHGYVLIGRDIYRQSDDIGPSAEPGDDGNGDGGSGNNNTLLYVGAGVGVVVAILAVALIWRSRQ